jgi:general secretion pathway protein K
MIFPTNSRRSRGAALIAVIVLIAIVSLACISTLRVISFDAELASAKIHGSRARQVAEMGIAVGTNAGITKRFDPLLHRADEAAGEGYDVQLISEGGRFCINAIIKAEDKELLKSMFIKWGLELEDAQIVVDSLFDWYDQDDEFLLNGAEVDFYKKEGSINQPFNRPFHSLEEMSLVRGMDLIERVKPDWREWFTVWSEGQLDVNEASAELLAAAGDIEPDRTSIVPETVRGPDGVLGTEDDVPFQDAASALDLMGLDSGAPEAARFTATAPLSGTIRVESTGYAEGAKRKIIVIIRNRAQNPTLLDRTEEIIP